VKVFISHSSTDKWIARRISEDLIGRGAETFLDEKDIRTGESIDATIQDHLADCDELLMLLSPAALSSTWVLIEIGGAKALKKRLIPITIHVPANELPSVLSGGLARDLNDIEVYYRELEQRVATGAVAPSGYDVDRARPRKTVARGIEWSPKIGERVQVAPVRPDPDSYAVGVVGWRDEMDLYLGAVATVREVEQDSPDVLTVQLDVDRGKFWWALDWIRPTTLARSVS
jgi:hypothetical protein